MKLDLNKYSRINATDSEDRGKVSLDFSNYVCLTPGVDHDQPLATAPVPPRVVARMNQLNEDSSDDDSEDEEVTVSADKDDDIIKTVVPATVHVAANPATEDSSTGKHRSTAATALARKPRRTTKGTSKS